jgi:hypothetical protein
MTALRRTSAMLPYRATTGVKLPNGSRPINIGPRTNSARVLAYNNKKCAARSHYRKTQMMSGLLFAIGLRRSVERVRSVMGQDERDACRGPPPLKAVKGKGAKEGRKESLQGVNLRVGQDP